MFRNCLDARTLEIH